MNDVQDDDGGGCGAHARAREDGLLRPLQPLPPPLLLLLKQ